MGFETFINLMVASTTRNATDAFGMAAVCSALLSVEKATVRCRALLCGARSSPIGLPLSFTLVSLDIKFEVESQILHPDKMASFAPALRTRASQTARIYSRQITTSSRLLRQGPGSGENFEQANDPAPRTETPNVSKTNELAVGSKGNRDAPLQESQEAGEKMRVMQAPNRANVWSRNQMPRELAMSGPRFEQTIIGMQVGKKRSG